MTKNFEDALTAVANLDTGIRKFKIDQRVWAKSGFDPRPYIVVGFQRSGSTGTWLVLAVLESDRRGIVYNALEDYFTDIKPDQHPHSKLARFTKNGMPVTLIEGGFPDLKGSS